MNLFCYICLALNTFMNSLINKTATEINDNALLGVCLKHVDVGSTLFNNMRICKKCEIPKVHDDFRPHKHCRDGISPICRCCEKKDRENSKLNKNKTVVIPDLDGEIWKDVVGFEGIYTVSSLGRVKALCVEKYRGRYLHKQPEKLLDVRTNKYGYKVTTLIKDKKRKDALRHRLVAQAFIPNPENKPCVNHKNGIKSDNRVENLEWATVSENTKHSFDNGLQVMRKGEDCSWSKLTNEQVIDIYLSTEMQKDLAKKYNISHSQVNRIRKGLRWSSVTINLKKQTNEII